MVKAKSLLVKRVGNAITFKDMQTGNRHYTHIKYIRAIVLGFMHYTYAGEYTPLPYKKTGLEKKQDVNTTKE